MASWRDNKTDRPVEPAMDVKVAVEKRLKQAAAEQEQRYGGVLDDVQEVRRALQDYSKRFSSIDLNVESLRKDLGGQIQTRVKAHGDLLNFVKTLQEWVEHEAVSKQAMIGNLIEDMTHLRELIEAFKKEVTKPVPPAPPAPAPKPVVVIPDADAKSSLYVWIAFLVLVAIGVGVYFLR